MILNVFTGCDTVNSEGKFYSEDFSFAGNNANTLYYSSSGYVNSGSALAIDENYIYFCKGYKNPAIYRVDHNGENYELVMYLYGLEEQGGLEQLNIYNGCFYGCDTNTGRLFKADPQNGYVENIPMPEEYDDAHITGLIAADNYLFYAVQNHPNINSTYYTVVNALNLETMESRTLFKIADKRLWPHFTVDKENLYVLMKDDKSAQEKDKRYIMNISFDNVKNGEMLTEYEDEKEYNYHMATMFNTEGIYRLEKDSDKFWYNFMSYATHKEERISEKYDCEGNMLSTYSARFILDNSIVLLQGLKDAEENLIYDIYFYNNMDFETQNKIGTVARGAFGVYNDKLYILTRKEIEGKNRNILVTVDSEGSMTEKII